jgi:hypothetical protein
MARNEIISLAAKASVCFSMPYSRSWNDSASGDSRIEFARKKPHDIGSGLDDHDE